MRSPPFIAALLAFVVYACTIPGSLVYDDVGLIRTDPRIQSPREWGRYFTESYNGGVDNLYRPLTSMTYAVQHLIHHTTAWPYHLVNVALHAGASALVALFGIALARRVGNDEAFAQRVGLIAGVLFAVHPVHVEAVANIVGRAESLCAIGSIGALLMCIAGPLTRRRVVGAWLLFAFAILAKEQAMLLPIAALAVVYVARRPAEVALAAIPLERPITEASPEPIPTISYRNPATRSLRDPNASLLFAAVAVTLAAYVLLREDVLHLKFWWDRVFLDPWIQPLERAHGLDRVLGPVVIAGRYLLLLIAPYRLHIDYGGSITPAHVTLGQPFLWLGMVGVLLWIVWFGFAWRRRDRASMAMLLAFAIVYGSIGNVVTLIGVNVAERLMYLPSVFFVVLIALAMARLAARWPRTTWATLDIIVALASVRTITYAVQWNHRRTFYPYLLAQEPRSLKAALLCVQESLEQKQVARAVEYGRQAVAIAPDDESPYDWLGKALLEAGEQDEAERVLAQGAAIKPGGSAAQRLSDLVGGRASAARRQPG